MLMDRVTKETTDYTRIELDMSWWLDPGETISRIVSWQIILGTTGWSEAPYPPPGSPPPYDPSTLYFGTIEADPSQTVLIAFVQSGTPGLVYTTQFVLDGTSKRRVTVEAGVQVLGVPPTPPVPPPPQVAFPPVMLPGQDGLFVPVTDPITGVPGMSAFPSYDIYQSPDSYALTGSMTVRGQPYGYYDTGTLLSLVSTTNPLSSSRAGINGGFEAGVPAIAGYGGFDLVTLYSSVQASPPPLVLHNVTYDATHVYPQVPLTAAQMRMLRKNMWVLTNSIDTTVSTAPAVPNGYKPENHYGSYVTGWATDGRSISVVGWTVPGSGHNASGQVPPVGTLDPGASNATAYFGAHTNVFGGNFVLIADPNGQPDSRLKTLQGLEIDFFNYSTTDYQIAVQGFSMAYDGLNNAQPTADSYGMKMSGFPNGIIVNYVNNIGLSIEAGIAITSNVFNANHWWSPPPWTGTPSQMVLWESQGYVDSNILSLKCWTSRDTATIGWPGASLHLGMFVDAQQFSVSTGGPMAAIVWNAQGYDGGIQLQNPAGHPILSTDSTGYIYPSIGNAANDAAAASLGVPVGAMYRNGSIVMVRVS